MVTIQHLFYRGNKRYKSESGVLYFSKSDPSFFRKWFNKNHVTPNDDSEEIRTNSVFEFIVYVSADYESILSVSEIMSALKTQSFLPKEISKHRNEIASFEIACFLLSYFQVWAKTNNYKKQQPASEIFLSKLASITSECFGIESVASRELVEKRIIFYSDRIGNEFDNIAEVLTVFILWGFKNRTPSLSGNPPSNDIEASQGFEELPAKMEDYLKQRTHTLKDQWNNWLLNYK